MDLTHRLSISYYKTITTLNEEHKIYLVQHQETGKIYVKKILDIYNIDVYNALYRNPIPGTPTIVDMYEDDHNLIIIEKYISGESLNELLNNKTFLISDICKLISELCVILDNLHNNQPPIIHRDIKPSNIIITEHNHVILLDFNAAKYHCEASTSDTILLGTEGYAAPEQYGFGASTPRTDIYSTGILIQHMAKSFSQVPKELADIIAKCIEINPKDRYQSIAELRDAIQLYINPSNKSANNSKPRRRILPPGFRTLTPWKMIIASIGYPFIFWLCLTVKFENTTNASTWLWRIFILIINLSIVFILTNYLNVQKLLPLYKSKHFILRALGAILLVILICSFQMLVLLMIESFIS